MSIEGRGSTPGPDQELELDALVRKAQAGDRYAFGQVVRLEDKIVRNLIYRLGVRESDVQDVAQEVWVRVWRKLGQFEGRSLFRTWLYTVTTSVIYNYRERNLGSAPERRELDDPVEDDFVDRLVDRLVDRKELLAALDSINPAYRDAVVLADVYGLTDREAAEIVGISSNAFSLRLSRSRRALRKLLSDHSKESGE